MPETRNPMPDSINLRQWEGDLDKHFWNDWIGKVNYIDEIDGYLKGRVKGVSSEETDVEIGRNFFGLIKYFTEFPTPPLDTTADSKQPPEVIAKRAHYNELVFQLHHEIKALAEELKSLPVGTTPDEYSPRQYFILKKDQYPLATFEKIKATIIEANTLLYGRRTSLFA